MFKKMINKMGEDNLNIGYSRKAKIGVWTSVLISLILLVVYTCRHFFMAEETIEFFKMQGHIMSFGLITICLPTLYLLAKAHKKLELLQK